MSHDLPRGLTGGAACAGREKAPDTQVLEAKLLAERLDTCYQQVAFVSANASSL
jgi:hypothetical protein